VNKQNKGFTPILVILIVVVIIGAVFLLGKRRVSSIIQTRAPVLNLLQTNDILRSEVKPATFTVPNSVEMVVSKLDESLKQKIGSPISGYSILKDAYPRYKINGQSSEIPAWIPFMGIRFDINNSVALQEVEKFFSIPPFHTIGNSPSFYTDGTVFCDYQLTYPKVSKTGYYPNYVDQDNPNDPLRNTWDSLTVSCSTQRDFFFWRK